MQACQTPLPEADNPYARADSGEEVAATELSKPVRQLHNQALAAINEDEYALATDYLQRAIRIEPRNGWSWHYLADINWRRGQTDRCHDMLDRAEEYAGSDTALVDANRDMRERCE